MASPSTDASDDNAEQRTSSEKQPLSPQKKTKSDDTAATIADEKFEKNLTEDSAAELSIDLHQNIVPKSPTDSVPEKSTGSPDKVESLLTEPEKPLVSRAGKGDRVAEKVKKSVRMQSTVEDTSDGASSGKTMALKPSPSVGTNLENFDPIVSPGTAGTCSSNGYRASWESVLTMMEEAWDRLKRSYVYFKGRPVGTLAALDPSADT